MLLKTENEVINDISNYILDKKNKEVIDDIDKIELYNDWIYNNNILIDNKELLLTALSFIENAKTMDKYILEESIIINKQNF